MLKQVILELIKKGPIIGEEVVEGGMDTDVDGMGEGDIVTNEEGMGEEDTAAENI